jgi:predicted DNA-binding transcriptional regulator AlpA
MTDRLIDDRELSRRVGRARSTLQKDRVAGRGVPYVRLGALVRYRESDVESYLASLRTHRSTSEPDPA